jgi:hypothetical protein
MKRLPALLACACLIAGLATAAEPAPDPWASVQRLIGDWSGTASGSAGEGSVRRRYAFVMNGRYIHEINITTYPPQERNRSGEVHEHWSFLSFDKSRQTLVLRQFHVEGFVNTFRQAKADAPGSAGLVFESESFENFSSAWRARESYVFLSDDAFIETFELAPPGQPYRTYSRTRLERVAR